MTITTFLHDLGFHTLNEGNCQQIPEQILDLNSIIDLFKNNEKINIMEIGFNGGHSAEIFLKSYDNVFLTSFDIGEYPYVEHCKNYISQNYFNRHKLILGDSKISIPTFISNNPTVTFDIIFIDGGHDYLTCESDLKNSLLLSDKNTILIMDDTIFTNGMQASWTIDPTKVWIDYISNNKIKEINRKEYCEGRGMSWGYKIIMDIIPDDEWINNLEKEAHNIFLKNKNDKKYIFVCWLGSNPLSNNRKKNLYKLKQISESELIFITDNNIHLFLLNDYPLHESYQYLSGTHKCDYMRTYLMHFYGGGYSDLKCPNGSWKKWFDVLYNSDKWIIGYREKNFDDIACEDVKQFYNELIGNCNYICKPQTKLTNKWYHYMILLLDQKLEKLKLFPASCPRDRAEISNNKYPIEWNEMLGRIFHRICFEYKEKLLYDLPSNIFFDYI